MSLNLEHLHRVHCVGVGGIGVSAVAKLLRLQGKEVSGSDPKPEIETVADAAAAGVIIKEASADNIAPDLDLLIYTSVTPEDQVERQAAAKLGIPQFEYSEFLGVLSRSHETIAVCGTNGKSTTTALLGLMLEAAGFDPMVIVGSKVKTFPYGNLRMSSAVSGQESGAKYFVVEACEYRAHLLNILPKHVVVTNIAEDHLDYYRDLAHIRETFQKFADQMPADGILVRNGNDTGASSLTPKGPAKTFGYDRAHDYQARDVRVEAGMQRFNVIRREPKETWEDVTLRVPGAFNVENALAAAAMARELGVSAEVIRGVLAGFTGIWRRFERIGEKDGATVISDYGHHPDAVQGTLEAARDFFPGRRLVLVFQPHQHDRTRKLFDEFVTSFDAADVLVLAEIYGVAGRLEGENAVSSNDLVQAVEKRGQVTDVRYAVSPAEAETLAREVMTEGDIVIVMGAGDIYAIAQNLVE